MNACKYYTVVELYSASKKIAELAILGWVCAHLGATAPDQLILAVIALIIEYLYAMQMYQ